MSSPPVIQRRKSDFIGYPPTPQGFRPQYAGNLPSPSLPEAASYSRPHVVGASDGHGRLHPLGSRISHHNEGEYWYPDDDASMVDSGDEADPESQSGHLKSNELGVLVAKRLEAPSDRNGTQLRSFSRFASSDVLSTYFPASSNSPLNDKKTAVMFWYFVNVTGPSMSLYERHPSDPSPMFQGIPVPKARQHIWTCKFTSARVPRGRRFPPSNLVLDTFPIIALHHPALLQAMLALGSLQMAKLESVPATASMKHYHLSLRRIAKNYQSPSRRLQPATLAATLLLGFYEVWNSDHDKWCRHMWGARAILKDIPLQQMTSAVLRLKKERRRRLQELRRHHTYLDAAETNLDEINTSFLAQISGNVVDYEVSGDVMEGTYTETDIETYEHYSDLFWWYCKMDVYQSILGGTRLL